MPTLTLDFTAEHATRAAAAFGKAMGTVDEDGIPRPANMAEVRAHVRMYIVGLTLAYERRAAAVAAEDGIGEIDPT